MGDGERRTFLSLSVPPCWRSSFAPCTSSPPATEAPWSCAAALPRGWDLQEPSPSPARGVSREASRRRISSHYFHVRRKSTSGPVNGTLGPVAAKIPFQKTCPLCPPATALFCFRKMDNIQTEFNPIGQCFLVGYNTSSLKDFFFERSTKK